MPEIEYICHPISGDVEKNIADIERIMSERHTSDNIPFAPYLTALRYLRDDIPEQRLLGMAANAEFFRIYTITKVYVCGERVSSGMQGEILLAYEEAIPIEAEPNLEDEVSSTIPFHMSYIGQRALTKGDALVAVLDIVNSGDLIAYRAADPPTNKEEYFTGKRGVPLSWDECFGLKWSNYRNRDHLMDEIASIWGKSSIQTLASHN